MDEEIFKLNDEDFPQSLLEIPQPPKQLFIKGKIPDWNSKFVTIVGSRKYSSYGKEACEKIISGLAGKNITIVSGLAIGIDTIAHKTALRTGLKTIAVPGSGIESSVIYPSINTKLADEIIKAGGCLFTEFSPDFKATAWSFPQRNRIMAGLADVILVIEASEKSGTLITARMGTDYNKEVAVVPASIFNYSSKGSNSLLRQGATPITCSEDLLELLGFGKDKSPTQQKLEFENCSKQEKKILMILDKPMTKDEIISEIDDMNVSEINSTLTILEIKGLVNEVCGEIHLV